MPRRIRAGGPCTTDGRTRGPRNVSVETGYAPLNTHKNARLKAFIETHSIEPVYTPTYASWLNAIESHLGPLKKFAIAGTNDPSHEYRRWRIVRLPHLGKPDKGSPKTVLAKFSRTEAYRHLAG